MRTFGPVWQMKKDFSVFSYGDLNNGCSDSELNNYKPKIIEFLTTNFANEDVEKWLKEFHEIAVRPSGQERKKDLELFLQKMANLCAEPHSVATLVNELLEILRTNKAPLLVSSFLQEIRSVAELDLDHIKTTLGSMRPKDDLAGAAMVDHLCALIKSERNPKPKVIEFLNQASRNYALSRFAEKVVTLLIGKAAVYFPLV